MHRSATVAGDKFIATAAAASLFPFSRMKSESIFPSSCAVSAIACFLLLHDGLKAELDEMPDGGRGRGNDRLRLAPDQKLLPFLVFETDSNGGVGFRHQAVSFFSR